ncbi:redoxin domain-containing protein [Dactylosporangium aurantiacum]|uniref:Redoxin domain-containing protein n=1 Tax=Dactylosporangium aurantiacum TaxID=35754 RepID=A0A9Q9IC24_9ACTN|nr:redoxin domain-containing protein [Dactylosporangium aurantiacum]MDG6105108.1 redoxin domain-containing protein [Dactylosporangium aurantiacum]UWZ51633.1 redoxin domain-containing protein [Dactylosporangium aurantiacum]
MLVQADRVGFADATGAEVTVAQLRGGARGVVLYFMRAASCPVCLRHARALAALRLADRDVTPVVVVPGGAAEAARVRRAAGDVRVVSSTGAGAHHAVGLTRTLLLQHSGTLLVDAAGDVRYRLGATLPTGSFDAAALNAAVAAL